MNYVLELLRKPSTFQFLWSGLKLGQSDISSILRYPIHSFRNGFSHHA